MKKTTLMLIIGAAAAFFGYRYFLKDKVTAVKPVSKEGIKGAMILPETTPEPAVKVIGEDSTKGTMIVPETSPAPMINESPVIIPQFTVLEERPLSTKEMIVVTYWGKMIPVGNNYYLGQGDKLEGTIDGGTFLVNRIVTMPNVNISGLVVSKDDILLS